jgi:hypothetical protein
MDHKKDIFTSKEDKWDFIIALVVIVIFSVFIYQFLFDIEEKAAIDPTTELEEFQIKPAESITENDELLYIDSNKYKTETIKAEDAYEHKKDSAVIISDFIKASSLVKEPEVIVNNEINKSIETDNKTTIPSKTNIDVVKEIVVTTKEPVIELKKEVVTKTISTTPKTETKIVEKTDAITFNCVIVVGAFREVKNKTAIINKLTSLGYAHKEGTLRGGLNYVGVPIDCNNKQINLKLLKELNQVFRIQSWIKRF